MNGNVRKKCYNEIIKEIKRTRIITIFNRNVRIREKAAAFLTFFGEKTIKKVWNSKIAVKRELIDE